MAYSSNLRFPLPLLLLLLLLPLTVIAKKEGPQPPTHMRFFLHDTVHGPNATTVRVAPLAARSKDLHFGDMYVIDDPLTAGPKLSSMLLGRAQGMYVVASRDPKHVALAVTANLVFTAGKHCGSMLAVVSRFSLSVEVAELAVVGGTGAFRGATGYAFVTTHSDGESTVLEWNVYVKKCN